MNPDLGLEELGEDGVWHPVDLDGDRAAEAVGNQFIAEARAAGAKAKLETPAESDDAQQLDDAFDAAMRDALREE